MITVERRQAVFIHFMRSWGLYRFRHLPAPAESASRLACLLQFDRWVFQMNFLCSETHTRVDCWESTPGSLTRGAERLWAVNLIWYDHKGDFYWDELVENLTALRRNT